VNDVVRRPGSHLEEAVTRLGDGAVECAVRIHLSSACVRAVCVLSRAVVTRVGVRMHGACAYVLGTHVDA
jgi:hypothetical protein